MRLKVSLKVILNSIGVSVLSVFDFCIFNIYIYLFYHVYLEFSYKENY